MRLAFYFCLLLVPAPAAISAEPAPLRGTLFMSPMGEPFRSDDSAADNVGRWFAAADGDGDGALTHAELQQDAGRFFAALDTDGDGEIAMAEMTRYENEIAPEVQLGLQMRGTGLGDWRGRGSRWRDRARDRYGHYDDGLEGAGRFAFLNIPQPVIAADFDLNRGVSRDEFARAAGQRFLLLDRDRDGRLGRAELPPLPQRRSRRHRERDDDAPIPPPMGNRRY